MMIFLEKEHKYLKNDTQYISVTTLLHAVEPKKDWNQIAEKYAKKHKRTVEDVKAEWKAENVRVTDRGSAYHLRKENEVLECTDYNIPIFASPVVNGVKESRSLKLEDGIYPELVLYLDSAKIAGQADLIHVEDGFIHISDYKTNKEITTSGFVNWEGKEAMLLHPVAHMPECKFSLYALQVNLYMYIILRHNTRLRMGTMKLIHARFDEDDQHIEDIIYDIPNLQLEVKNIVELHKQGKL